MDSVEAGLRHGARQLAGAIDRSATFLLSGHVNIDGDSLGSMLGMLHHLRRSGKRATALCFEPLLRRYAFLAREGDVEVFDPAKHAELARSVDCFMMFDFSAPARIPGLWEEVARGKAFKVCFDHHVVDSPPGDLNLHDVHAPSTGSIVLALLRELGATIDAAIAKPLLVAITTDTGWFRYVNTSAAVLRDVADLVDKGIDAAEVYRHVYQQNDAALIRLMGRVATDLHEEVDGELVWASIPFALVRELGVGAFETDELLDLLRTARKATCVALFRELQGGAVRVNLRSRGALDVSSIARRIGGGGHAHAAGATVAGPLATAQEGVLAHLRQAMRPATAAPAPALRP